MKVTITPAPLQGSITPPPSKSQAHRVIIAAALASGESLLRNLSPSQGMGRLRRKILRFMKKSGIFLRKHAKKLFSSWGKSVTIKAIPFSLNRSHSREKPL